MEHEHSPMEDGEKGARNVSGPGAFLKREREKKGLSRQRVAEITMLRSHMVEALENEDWRSLPAPPFVRGFIRSYAKALHLDEQSMIELYNKIAPAGKEPFRPLVTVPAGKKKGILLLILMPVAVAAMIYVWIGYGPSDKVRGPEEIERSVVLSGGAEAVGMKSEAPQGIREDDRLTKAGSSDTTLPKPVAPSVERPDPGESSATGESRTGHAGEEGATASVPETAGGLLRHELTGTVSARTWVRIRIDDQEPKEYMFQPGQRPRWRAKDGFRIVIGNAGGFGFDLNGKKMTSLGRPGQVVRLSLPEDFREAGGED